MLKIFLIGLFSIKTVVHDQYCVLDFAMRITIRISVECTCAASALNTVSYLDSRSKSPI